MVNGTIKELSHYLPESICDIVMSYINSIHDKTEEKTTYLLGTQIYGKVMSYSTKSQEECLIEAHNRYVDVQISIVGAERIDVFQRGDLQEKVAYNEETDVAFYEYTDKGYYATVDNMPGRFSMFFAEDAHKPQININGTSGFVKKFVVKIDKALFER